MKDNQDISRREAIIKTGKYAAMTAAATFIVLNPKQSQAASPSDPPPPGFVKAEPLPSKEEEQKKSYNG